MIKIHRIKPIVKKEFRQIRRDIRTLTLLVFMPMFLLILFGYALNFDVTHITTAVYDEDKTRVSREFISSFFHSEYFDQTYYLSSKKDINELLDHGSVAMVLVVPYDFSKKLLAGQQPSVQILVDGSNANKASTVIGYATGVVQDYSINIITDVLTSKGGAGLSSLSLPIDFQPRVWYNPDLKSARFLIPGLIAFILMVTSVISTSMAVVKEKEQGTIEQLIVSPITPLELILGKTVPYIFLSLATAYLTLFLGWALFGISIKGSQIMLFILTFIYLFVALGVGLLISTISNTQQLAFQLSLMLTMLPTMLLSGFIFPIRNMPLPIQWVTTIIPAKYFMIALRIIILKGSGVGAYWRQFVYLIIFGVVLVGLSWTRMREKHL
jgi:ABC-2 type transport system permease protein